MTSAQDSIRAQRRLSNKIIADHQVEKLRPIFAPDVKVIVGDGSVIFGAEVLLQSFAEQFKDRRFGAYSRNPELVEVDKPGRRAVEAGRWIATADTGSITSSGRYMAVWRVETGQWIIEAEMYVTLS